jgi:hypothetical protein
MFCVLVRGVSGQIEMAMVCSNCFLWMTHRLLLGPPAPAQGGCLLHHHPRVEEVLVTVSFFFSSKDQEGRVSI